MARVLPGEVTLPDLTNIGDGRIDIIKRELRAQVKKPVPDRVEFAPGQNESIPTQIQPGSDIEIPFSASYDLGSEAFFVLTTKNQQGIFSPSGQANILATATTTVQDGSVSFTNIDKNARFLFAYIRNSNGYRVSSLTETEIVMDADQDVRDDVASFVESGSQLESQKNMQDKTGHGLKSLQEISDAVHDIIVLYHDKILSVEEHVRKIAGLNYADPGDDPQNGSALTQSQWENAPGLTETSRLFPEGYRKVKPKFENAEFMTGEFDVNDENERSRLLEAQNHLGTCYETLPSRSYEDWTLVDCETTDADGNTVQGDKVDKVTVYDETQEAYVQYDTEAEVQERLDEISALINGGDLQDGSTTDGFNAQSEVDELFTKRYFWINQWSNRKFGYETRVRSQQQGANQTDEQEDKTGKVIDEVGL